MIKRPMIFGDYDTAARGWTLTGWTLSDPVQVTNFIQVPGRVDGDLDASTVLTDGDPRYGSRTLEATFETSEGTRETRNSTISVLVNWLDGYRVNIVLPDYPNHYLTGRLQVQVLYSDPAHASVRITAVCAPWFYKLQETVVALTATTTEKTQQLLNLGRRAVVPLLTIAGGSVNVSIEGTGYSWALGAGTYALPDMQLRPNTTMTIRYSGTGTLSFRYREAVLR